MDGFFSLWQCLESKHDIVGKTDGIILWFNYSCVVHNQYSCMVHSMLQIYMVAVSVVWFMLVY